MAQKYSDKLVQEVLALYSDEPKIISMAKRGDEFLGIYLKSKANADITLEEVILSSMTLEELKERALVIRRRQAMVIKWEDEMKARENITVTEEAPYYYRV